jgi:hypothetical protein
MPRLPFVRLTRRVLLAISYAANVPHTLRAAILVRSAGYERGFADRSGEAVILVVQLKSEASASDGDGMTKILSQLLKQAKIGGRRGRVVQITHESSAKTLEQIRSQRAEIVYFAAGLEQEIQNVPVRDTVPRILVCANGADVSRGCTLGVELDGDRPRLVLNLTQANAAGLRFDAGLLRLARIVR